MKKTTPDPAAICFGMSRDLDRQPCGAYLQLLGKPELAETLASRLTPEEIEELVDLTTSLMRKYLSKQEYHKQFLSDIHTD